MVLERYLYKPFCLYILSPVRFKDKWFGFLEKFKASALENASVSTDVNAYPEEARGRRNFHDSKIISYENRIRMFSTANKVFRYFASVKIVPDESDPAKHAEVFMTPYDFLRSLTPGMPQPEGLGLEQYNTADYATLRKARIADNLFSKNVLISFPEYIFLLTVLSASPEKFALAFKMFDLDGDGMLDYCEFNKIQTIVRRLESKLQSYARERAPLKAGSSFAIYLFGDRLDRKISLQEFLNFRQRLQKAVLQVEFELYEPDDSNTISAENFARMILARADLSEADKEVVVGRLLTALGSKEICSRVTFQDVEAFFLLLSRMEEVETALRIYRLAESSVDRATLKRVINLVTDRPASECVVDILFAMFDANG
ncbi:EF hand [Trichuris suis]|nr:EF hand [Trichuris suis]